MSERKIIPHNDWSKMTLNLGQEAFGVFCANSVGQFSANIIVSLQTTCLITFFYVSFLYWTQKKIF